MLRVGPVPIVVPFIISTLDHRFFNEENCIAVDMEGGTIKSLPPANFVVGFVIHVKDFALG